MIVKWANQPEIDWGFMRMSKVTCSALVEESRVPPIETRGPLNRSNGRETSTSSSGLTAIALTTPGETNLPVGRTSITDK